MKHTLTTLLLLASTLAIEAQQVPKDWSNYPSVTLLDSTSVQIANTGSGHFLIKKTVRIQNAEGALNYRVLKYNYDALTAEAHFSKVEVRKANGKKQLFEVSRTADYVAPARMIYWGERQIMMELGALNPGDTVDYEIQKSGFTYALLNPTAENDEDESRFIPPMKGEFYDIVPFWTSEPTLRKVYRMAIPRQRDMQYTFYQGQCQTSVRYQDDQKIYTFAMNDMTPIFHEPNGLDPFDYAPKLVASSTPEWQEKSRWFYGVNEAYGSFKPIPEAVKKVKELLKGKKTELDSISVLSHWVADNIRYSGVSMGKGEGYTLHNLTTNYTDRCGVCKDIAGTLIAFLRIAGFEAYPAMTMAGSRIEKGIPADHFNHCVVVVRRRSGVLQPIDPTWIPFCRELWSSAEQQQNYLPGTKEGSDLCLTPVSPAENHYLRIKAQTHLATDGTLKGTFILTAEGQSDSGIRRIFTTGWQCLWFQNLEAQLLTVSPLAKVTSIDWGKNPKDYQAAPLKLIISFEIPDYALSAGSDLLVKPLVLNHLFARYQQQNRLDLSVDTRRAGFKIGCSQLLDLEETMTLPSGYTLTNGKSDETKGTAASYKGSISGKGNKLQVKEQLSLHKRVYTDSEWAEVRGAVQKFRTQGDYLILHKKQ